MTAASPLDGQTLKLSRPIGTKFFQRMALLHGERQLAQCFRRRDHCSPEAVFIQPRQRTGVVSVGMGQKHGVQTADLLPRQAGIWVLWRVGHFSTVHQKATRFPLYQKAVAAMLAHAAGDEKLHVMPPSACLHSG